VEFDTRVRALAQQLGNLPEDDFLLAQDAYVGLS
jgi:hypothetical protein